MVGINQKNKINRLTNAFIKDFTFYDIRKNFIEFWAESNFINIHKVIPNGVVKKFIDKTDSTSSQMIRNELKKTVNILTLKDLEEVFECCIESHRRKKQGTVYTPDFIIDYLIEQSLKIKSEGEKYSFCDPACGSGGFLIRAAEILNKHINTTFEKLFEYLIFGIDNDEWAIEHAKCLIELFLLKKDVKLKNPKINIFCLDTLLLSPKELLNQVNHPDGFSFVSTNPPYVKVQNLEMDYRKKLLKTFPEFIHGSFSLAPLFLIRCHELISAEGIASLITQNNLYTSLSGKYVREYLQSNMCLNRIVDFGHNHVFSNASAYTCLIFMDKKPSNSFEFSRIWKNINSETLKKTKFSKLYHRELNSKKWRLATRTHLENIHKIEKIGTPLGKLTQIRVGFATLKDSIFFVKDNGDYCETNYFKDKVFNIEKNITVPAIKIADIKRASDLKHNKRRIIFPYKRRNGQFILISEDSLRINYPVTFKYLELCKPELQQRDKGKKYYEAWYAWGRTQCREAKGPKLLTKTFNKRPQFLLDTGDELFCNGYGIFPLRGTLFGPPIPIDILSLILNSKVMNYYTKLTSFQLEGNYQCYQKNFIEKFGIPELSSDQIKKLKSLQGVQLDTYIISLYNLSTDDINEVLG